MTLKQNSDEDSPRVNLHLTKEKQDNKKSFLLFRFLLNETKEYFFSLYRYSLEKFFAVKNLVKKYSEKGQVLGSSLKTYFLSRMFWGRGNLYRLVVLFAIAIPICASLVFIKYADGLHTKPANNTVLDASIAIESAKTNSVQGSQGQLIESNVPVANQGQSSWYKVKTGDTLASIAKGFNINPAIIQWENQLNPPTVTAGQELNIIPVTGLIYTVKKTDTLASIANTYAVSEAQVASWNFIAPTQSLQEGQNILIPGVTPPSTTTAQVTTKSFHFTGGASVGCPVGDNWCYLQADPRWGSLILGGEGARNANSWMNVTRIGCLITDVAMVATYYGFHITPGDIAVNRAYFAGYGLFNLSGLGVMNVQPLGTGFGSVSWTEINQHLALGQPVIVGMPEANHFVVLDKYSNGEYTMQDPAYGGQLAFNKYYRTSEVDEAYLYTPINK